MRHLPAAFAVLAACSFPHGKAGGDAKGSEDAPIDSPMIDAPGDTTADAIDAQQNVDTDADGIFDQNDNCPLVPNMNQRDHDGDLHGDACDKCPHLVSASDPDGDLDGVGDACDPRPVTAGDSVALWEGFYDASSINAWTINGGSWAVANGVLMQTSTATSDVQLVAPMTVPRAAVTSSATIVSIGAAMGGFTTPHASVSSGVATGQWYWCSVVDEASGDKIYATTDWAGSTTNYPSAAWPGTFAVNSVFRLTSALIGANNVCTVVEGTTSASVMGAHGPSTAGRVQVATRTAAVNFDYVFVVAMP